ncbi:MAG: LptF/LptG family permease, partial [Myxococcota bacterium]
MTGLRLSRYVGTSYLGAVLLTTTGLTMLVVAASMIEGGSRLAGAGVGTVLKLALFQGLAFSYQILPAASFLGALIAGTLLARRGELLGVQVSGIGMGPIWRGFTGVALLVAFSGYMLGEWVVPPAVNGLERTQEDELEGRQDGITAFYAYRLSWFRSGDLVLHLPSIADQDATVFETPAVYETREGELVAI